MSGTLSVGLDVERGELERLFYAMARIRAFEETVMRQFLANEIRGTTHLCSGQEAIDVGVCAALEASDVVAATYRGHGACLAMGTDPGALLAEFMGRETGVCGGRAGSMNVIDLAHGVLGCFGIVGGSIAAATGAGLAADLAGDGSAAVAFFGEGAVNQAYFHECLNFAGLRRLPVLYACANNLYGEWTPLARSTAGGRVAQRAEAYGIPWEIVDGNDVLAVRDVARRALARARAREGPTLVEFLTYRHSGHSRSDPGKYRPPEEVAAWMARDPLTQLAGRLGAEAAAALRGDAEQEVARALAIARAAPPADPGRLGTAVAP